MFARRSLILIEHFSSNWHTTIFFFNSRNLWTQFYLKQKWFVCVYTNSIHFFERSHKFNLKPSARINVVNKKFNWDWKDINVTSRQQFMIVFFCKRTETKWSWKERKIRRSKEKNNNSRYIQRDCNRSIIIVVVRSVISVAVDRH